MKKYLLEAMPSEMAKKNKMLKEFMENENLSKELKKEIEKIWDREIQDEDYSETKFDAICNQYINISQAAQYTENVIKIQRAVKKLPDNLNQTGFRALISIQQILKKLTNRIGKAPKEKSLGRDEPLYRALEGALSGIDKMHSQNHTKKMDKLSKLHEMVESHQGETWKLIERIKNKCQNPDIKKSTAKKTITRSLLAITAIAAAYCYIRNGFRS